MKHKLLKLIPMWMLTGLLPSALNATDFTYTYEGQTITYTILDENAKTVKTKSGNYTDRKPGNKVTGTLTLPETVYYKNEAYTLTSIGYYAFYGCSGLTSVTIPNSVTSILESAFERCSGLTSVTLPNSVTEIKTNAFAGCNNLTHDVYNNKIFAYAYRSNREQVKVPDGIKIIAGGAFSGYSGLTGVTLPNSVTTIGEYALYGCSGLTSLTLPNSLITIGTNAFSGCHKLISYSVDEVTPNSVSIEVKKADSSSNFKLAAMLDNRVTQNGTHTFYGLISGKLYWMSFGFVFKESFFSLTSTEVRTASADMQISVNSTTATTTVLVPSVNIKGGTVKKYMEYWDGITGKPSGEIQLTGLRPNTSYTFSYVVKGESGWELEKSITVKTKELELTTQPGQAMNMTTALLSAKTNMSELEENVGFEWRRYDAPETLPSQKVMCAVVDGMLMGALSNLNPDVYYNYRPFYTSNSGNTYYGDWVTIFTGDANVYFDPTVRTYTTTNVGETGATIRGYALRGSDEIKRQGFQYWSDTEATSRAANGITEVEVSGTRLTYPLSGLKPGTTYSYRVFVETAGGTTYGDTVSFTTKGEESGIEEVEADAAEEAATVVGYWNVQGVRSDKPYRGLNLVRYSDGTVRKEIR